MPHRCRIPTGRKCLAGVGHFLIMKKKGRPETKDFDQAFEEGEAIINFEKGVPTEGFSKRSSMNTVLDLLKTAKALVLDFDGTLVDSNPIKLKAFEKCFAEYPEHFETIMAYCRSNHHTHRHEKFGFVFENILKQPYTPEIEKRLLEIYARETTEQVIAAKEIPGAGRFLEQFVKGKLAALLSSTPHETLLHILERRGLKKYFTTVQGAPINKAEWLQQFAQTHALKPVEILFIGDSAEDFASAKKAGVLFSPPNFKELSQKIRR